VAIRTTIYVNTSFYSAFRLTNKQKNRMIFSTMHLGWVSRIFHWCWVTPFWNICFWS